VQTTPYTTLNPAASPAARRWLYSLGNLGCAIPYQAVNAALLYFYSDVRRLDPAWAAAVMTGFALYNAINNPLLGYLSDRTHTRWGRRIPYILLGTLPYALLFAALFLAPFDGRSQPIALLIYFAIALFLFETLATVVQTAYYALLPEMFVEYSERTGVAVGMNIFMTVGLLVGAALPILLAEWLGWAGMGLLLAAISAVALYASTAGMFERLSSLQAANVPLGRALRATLVNRSFVAIVVAQTMRHFATATLSAGMAFYTKYSLQADPGVTSLILGTAFIVAGLALWPWKVLVANRYSARATLMLAYLALGAAVLPLAIVRSVTGALFASGLVGVALAGLILMGDVVLSDVIDEDEVRTGQRREGMYFGMSGLIIQLAYALAAVVFGWLSTSYGYNPRLEVQPALVDTGFRLFMSIPPAIGALLAVLALFFYPLHGQRLQQVQRSLADRRAAR
jgi:glycoside/pentoside/hexuronide:cation symporter, GPH family